MTQFHEGQEVEVRFSYDEWRKAKILHPGGDRYIGEWWYVQFPDGTRGVFDVEHIRAVKFDLQKEWESDIKKLRDAGALP